jgi:Ca-activated chloride channel family protein
MKAARQSSSNSLFLLTAIVAVLVAPAATATTQLLLTRGEQLPANEYTGVVELMVNPGFDDAKVSISVDGQRIADGLQPPYRVIVDFGPAAVEHKLTVVATGAKKRRVQWSETINRGHLPLTVKVTPVNLAERIFEAKTTAQSNDPVQVVELWDNGVLISSASEAPFRFTVPAELVTAGFVQVTARTKSGEEAADFWTITGDVHAESIDVRTVPIFVSVVDRNGVTLDNVDRSLFRILDNNTEAKIVEFGKAFDQPISIALLLDSSASMTYSMERASKAAREFSTRVLKAGDKCSVYAVQDVPRRKLALSGDNDAVGKALQSIAPTGRTALYDAIETAIRELKNEKVRRAIVVLTDGDDTSSISSYEEIEKNSLRAGIPIYFIAYSTGTKSEERDIERLKHLAAQTGGFVATATEHNLAQKYREIEKDLRAQFAILYQVTDYARQNEWRRIQVMLRSPKLTARTIRGYFAP